MHCPRSCHHSHLPLGQSDLPIQLDRLVHVLLHWRKPGRLCSAAPLRETRYELQLIRTQIALCDLQSREEKLKDNRMWGTGGKVSKPGSWASSPTNREALWNKLCESL